MNLELQELGGDQDKIKAFTDEAGVGSCFPKIIKQGYSDLNLKYYFTGNRTRSSTCL